MVILVSQVAPMCDTYDQGAALQQAIRKSLSELGSATLDFYGVPGVTSSFINGSLVDLLDDYSLDTFKTLIQIRRVNRQVANMIRYRVAGQLPSM